MPQLAKIINTTRTIKGFRLYAMSEAATALADGMVLPR
jgi:hypothetical protein